MKQKAVPPRCLPRVSKQDGQPLESAIQAQIVQALKLKGWLVWEMQKGTNGPTGNRRVFCTPGIPDLYVFHKSGRALWIEVKRPRTGKLSDTQKERHHELKLCGLPVHVVTSLDDVLAVIG